MRLWRVAHHRHAGDAWSGEGARRSGGRWNSPGRPVVYASEHAALAVLEVLVHVTTADLPAFRITSAALPEEAIGRIPPARLPPAWAAYPFGPASQAVGDAWLAAGDDVALRVPSALVPGDNVLLNPLHPGFRRLARDDGVLPIPAATRLR